MSANPGPGMTPRSDVLARRARTLFIVATLIGSVLLAFTPGVPAVIALSASPDPSASADAESTPTPEPPTLDPTPEPPAPDPTPDPDPAASPEPDPATTLEPDPAASPEPDPAASPEPGPAATPAPDPVADPDPQATPGPTSSVVPVAPPEVRLILGTSADLTSRPRIDPGARLGIDVGLTAAADIPASRLSVGIPTGWSIVDAAGGGYDAPTSSVTWDVDPVAEGVTVEHQLDLRAPATSPVDGGVDFKATFSSGLDVAGTVVAGPDLTILVAPPVAVEHTTLARVPDLTLTPTYMREDTALTDVQRFEMVRVRFQVRNEDDLAVSLRPRLEYRPASGGAFVTVPADDSVAGFAFHVGREWVSAGQSGGTRLGPDHEAIPVDGILSREISDPDQVRIPGGHSMGPNPSASLALPPLSYSEVEFSIRPTTDATYLAGYEFRITDDGTSLIGAVTAALRMGPEPALLASPVQHRGISVGAASDGGGAPVYRLIAPGTLQVNQAQDEAALAGGAADAGIHGPYGITADQCAFCHSGHTAKGAYTLVVSEPPKASLCFRCHDELGTGADSNVEAQYTDPRVPANSPATGSYYSHDALATGSGHTSASDNEFGGVSNRHSECVDCHNSHTATDAPSVQTATGWTVPGGLANVPGVSVANGAANRAPTYALLDGGVARTTLEYQLCLKCHSGWTTLRANDPDHPSSWAEDKGVELNPANDSFHPIEAAGKNRTLAMKNSLAGSSPYKLWSFTVDSTIRCVNCHGDYRKFDAASPPDAGSDLAPHANAYRGNLMQNYRDRDLKPFTEPYRSDDFALCYMCHAEAPFADVTGSDRGDTNFRYHGLHLTGIRNAGAVNGDIDTPGAGRGDALCAECHFRIHSNANAGDFRTTPAQSGTDAGLVNFAPNVGQYTDLIEWDRTGLKTGNCTLTCHGYTHDEKSY